MSKSRQSYTLEQLQVYSDSIKNNGVVGAVQFYDDMYDSGYNYAGWAVGVARDDTVTGKAATNFLTKTANRGVGGKPPRDLTNLDLDKIKKNMAQGYVNALMFNTERNGGVTNQDVTYEQTRAFHKKAFEANGLSIENWTLETPMYIIEQLQGKEEVEKRWQRIRDSSEDLIPGGDVRESLLLYDYVDNIASLGLPSDPEGKNKELVKKAKQWLKTVGPPLSRKTIKILREIFGGQSPNLGGSQQSQLMAISLGPSFNYTSHKKDSIAGFTLIQAMENAVDTATSTLFNGHPAYQLAQTTQPTCQGDASGRGGGVKSGSIGKEVKPTSGSATIIVEGKQLVREGDKCTMNNANIAGIYTLV